MGEYGHLGKEKFTIMYWPGLEENEKGDKPENHIVVYLPGVKKQYEPLVGQCFSTFLAVGDDHAAFEAEPVKRSKSNEDNQRKLKNGDLADHI